MDPDDTYREDTYRRASGMPLMDAAYYFWTQRDRLDAIEHPRPAIAPGAPRDEASIKRTIQDLLIPASEGPAFARLKRTHPDASDDAVKQAIKAALAFEAEYRRCYRETLKLDPFGASRLAVEMARAQHPGLAESTYQLATFVLGFETR